MSMPESILTEIQKLEQNAIIELYELDATAIGGEVYRFHGGTNKLNQNIVWKGDTYTRYPVKCTGFEFTGKGSLPRPKLVVSNYLSTITTLLLTYDDLLGAKFTRKRTYAKFLDAVNFPGGVNPTADPDAAFVDDIFYVDRKVSENRHTVEFELTSAFDLAGVQIPKRPIVANACPWKYRGADCNYTGTNYFTVNDVPTTDPAKDVCGKRLKSCELRFGDNEEVSFGGFPGSGLLR